MASVKLVIGGNPASWDPNLSEIVLQARPVYPKPLCFAYLVHISYSLVHRGFSAQPCESNKMVLLRAPVKSLDAIGYENINNGNLSMSGL